MTFIALLLYNDILIISVCKYNLEVMLLMF